MEQSASSASAFGNTLKGVGTSLLNFGINAALMAVSTLAIKGISNYIHEFENGHHFPISHFYPQSAQRFIVLLLPIKPVSNEYPLCPAVIAVEPHLNQWGIIISSLYRLFFIASFMIVIIIILFSHFKKVPL